MIKFFRRFRKEQLMTNTSTKYFKYAIGEILLVVIGILIALGINNLNDQKKTDEAVINNLERIENEIRSNQKRINRVFDYHKMVRDSIKTVILPDNLEEAQMKMSFWKGHQIFRLQDAAFQTAIQSGVSQNIDISLLEKLNALYSTQTFYNDLSKSVTQGLYTLDFSSRDGFGKVKNIVAMTMEDVYYLELELNEGFDVCLAEISELKNR